ncbi:inhibitor of growth proteins N-terminal histone-binding-domain-containing protein [Cercophora newfieldiana]|uniref:Chromatin modification-related protein n=1 Tax=Cercophora newfieldiana TaxID=92897 RepID=A0AA39YS24_9PEZI|nr:inhibitor of growth proteins N-terminal histone-binding-domain-containing protein [Cercophora newfieldiana]
MPRDDLSIDFVRTMPPVEALDPALILDEWINRTQNLPEEIRHMQDEIAEKDRAYDKLIREIEEKDGRIQKWIKAHGSHQNNPKEEEYRTTIRKNYVQAEKLADEKIKLIQKLQQTMDKHIRQLDVQIKLLYDRNELGFVDPDELPSLIRPSAANTTNSTPVIRPVNASAVTTALNPITNNASQSSVRSSSLQIRNSASQQHASASAPATPAASMIMNRQARETSAGPSGNPKRVPRLNTALMNLPTTSSGLARHSSLGPGTPKGHQTASGTQRAGSAGPRASTKSAGGGTSRKSGTPTSAVGRKKGTPAATGGANKSGLSRVKRAAKNSPSSTAESELSDADSGSGEESDARTGGRGTPALSRSGSNQASSQNNPSTNKEGSNERGPNSGASGPNTGGPRTSHHPGTGPGHTRHRSHGGNAEEDDDEEDEDAMEVDDEDAGDDKKYCLCQNVSFGDMVACDNDDCPYEWFHWSCVGLKSEPNGTWYCPECNEAMRKKGRAAL